jgi:tRNA A58 N-methylase Trm61
VYYVHIRAEKSKGINMYNAYTVPIQGDMSRADVVVLTKYCSGKKVVEFGMGGSTLLLARCTQTFISYEDDEMWFQRTQDRISQIPDKIDDIELILQKDPPKTIPSDTDTLFVDGNDTLRKLWIEKLGHIPNTILVHDSRRTKDFEDTVDSLKKHFLKIDTIQVHAQESNIIVVTMRPSPIELEDWNKTEIYNHRVSWDEENYISSYWECL